MNDERDFEAALDRAIQRGQGAELRQRCDPCQAKCLQCTAVMRAVTRHYWGAVTPPAHGSSWSTTREWPQVVAELEELARIPGLPGSLDCDGCRSVVPTCGCRGGACNLPAAGVSA
jgi:hypothetical protein